MNYARVENDIALEVVHSDPNKLFTPEIAALFEEVPDNVIPNSTRNGDGTWDLYVPPIEEPQATPEPQTPAALRIAEIEAELTAIDAASARPLRAILAATTSGGTVDPADVARINELEAQAVALRAELAEIED